MCPIMLLFWLQCLQSNFYFVWYIYSISFQEEDVLRMEVKVQLISICIFLYLQFSTADECACATGNVHVRSGAGTTHSILGTLPTDSCLAFKGHLSTVSGTHWANVDYHGQVSVFGVKYFFDLIGWKIRHRLLSCLLRFA